MIKFLRNLFAAFLIWIKPPKLGQIYLDPSKDSLDQNVKVSQEGFEVVLEDWEDTIKAVFETDDFADPISGISRANRPSDEILKKQISMFYKDYRKLNKKVDELYTKTVNSQDLEWEDKNLNGEN